MITINLLPDELKPVERTSPKNLLTILGGILLIVIAVIIFSLNRSALNRLRGELNNKKQERENLKKFEAENTKLAGLVKSFESYKNAVISIMEKKSNVSEKLYYFAQIFAKGNHPVWIEDLNISLKKSSSKRRRRKKSSGGVKYNWQMGCFCASGEIETATRFHRSIQQDPLFFEGFSAVMNIPQFTRSNIVGNYQQKIGYKFKLDIEMQAKPKKVKKNVKNKRSKKKGKQPCQNLQKTK